MIDHFTETDLPHVAALLRGLNALHVARVPQRFHDAADETALAAFLAQQMAEGAQALVYRAEGVPRGYLLWKRRDMPASAVDRARRLAVLDHIAVAPSWRRRGIGRRLVARFEAEARAAGCEGWITMVHAFNGASAGLMRQSGAALAVEVLEKRLG
ncbi:GNAT family N-acetyltransferase [Salipiger sp. P9]|uniref:GNAT family N-acetyltransferase n=1 Tax=Salipiger pentaromativorans TaxID=2943193 RepID=UPI002157414D|nr:GNAT family N-acetyltransferase [Salipiger pentaromativorans]MCR8549898.1 GNAT family N-acetyltransferase [Salipiger pentaromativorans]